MSRFLVEIPVPQPDRLDMERAARTLRAAHSRLSAGAVPVRVVVAGVTVGDARLVCLIDAETVETVRSLVTLALLPAGRIRELLSFTGLGEDCRNSDRRGPNPVADLAP